MKKRNSIIALVSILFISGINSAQAGIIEQLGKREGGSLGPVFWLPVGLAVLLGVIVVFSTTGKEPVDSPRLH